MAKKAKETVTVDPLEDKLVDFVFNSDDFPTGVFLTGTPTITEIGSSDLTLTPQAVGASSLIAQCHVDGGSAGTMYLLRCQIDDDGSPAQTHIGYGDYYVAPSET